MFIHFRVLELGCGAALPSIYAMLQGAHVTFQDYVSISTFTYLSLNKRNTELCIVLDMKKKFWSIT